AANGQLTEQITLDSTLLNFGGAADLVTYIGHDGLMEFSVDIKFNTTKSTKDVMILACYSKHYFSPLIQKANANPLLWTTHLMAPEAYTLKAAIDGWLLNENGKQIAQRAAQAYNKYQKCGIKGAQKLMTTGY
ncbi:hypothetical protein OAH12_01835, partial [Cyclobacteriaceae bacterium]|nr:hypothetical protein [Cyclobacteriaceae bacterium]